MVLFCILAIILLILVLVIALAVSTVGAGAIIIFGDVFVCIAIIVFIMRKIIKKKKRK